MLCIGVPLLVSKVGHIRADSASYLAGQLCIVKQLLSVEAISSDSQLALLILVRLRVKHENP
jgi:hypothetical protein